MNSRSEKTQSSNGGTSTSQEVSLDGGMELGVNARAFYKLNNTYDLVPTLSFYNVSVKAKIDPAPPTNTETVDSSQTAFEVGLGLNAKTKNALLIGGISFVNTTKKSKRRTLTTFRATQKPKQPQKQFFRESISGWNTTRSIGSPCVWAISKQWAARSLSLNPALATRPAKRPQRATAFQTEIT